MQQKIADFAAKLGLEFSDTYWQKLYAYAELIWQKKDQLNLTSVSAKNEIFTRHLADGMACAALCQKYFTHQPTLTVADMGSGAGYIGITVAIMCPHVQVTLVESLQKRCLFLNWAIVKLGLDNVVVKNVRLGQEPVGTFDLVTERAMGPLTELLPLLAACAKPKGVVCAYQSQAGQVPPTIIQESGLCEGPSFSYTLPEETKTRYLMVFTHGHR